MNPENHSEEEIISEEEIDIAEIPEEDVQEQPEVTREEADEVLNSALEQLRREKEKASRQDENQEGDIKESSEEITTENLFQNSSARTTRESFQESISRYEGEGTLEKDLLIQEAEVDQTPAKNLKARQTRAMLIVAAIVILVGAIVMALFYKITVYDPAVSVTEDQSEVYDQLIAYADEYSMLSEAEKLELLDMDSSYDSLSDYQKTKLDEYFLDQTGQNYNELLYTILLLDQNTRNEQNTDYTALEQFARDWPDLDAEGRKRIQELNPLFTELSAVNKEKINDIFRQTAGMTFEEALEEVNSSAGEGETGE